MSNIIHSDAAIKSILVNLEVQNYNMTITQIPSIGQSQDVSHISVQQLCVRLSF